MVDPDLEIIQAVLAGDADRYAKLVDKYQGPSLRLAFSILGNLEDARDASQEAFISAYQSLAQFRGRAKFSTWLYRIVVNKCKDVCKLRSRRPAVVASVGAAGPGDNSNGSLFFEPDDPAADPVRQAANRELAYRLSQAIGALPMKQRAAFALHHLHGLSLEAAAAVMGCRTGTVKVHVYRAMEHLRARLTPWWVA